MQNGGPARSLWHMRLAVGGTVLGILIITLAGAWAEARWPNAAGAYVTIKPQTSVDVAATLWQLRRIDGVRDAIAVFRGDLSRDEIEDTGWLNVWFYANQTSTPTLAFLPPDPLLRLHQGRLPAMHSPDEAILGYELAQVLHLGVGDTVAIRQRPFRVVGIWGPSSRYPGNFVQISASAAEAIIPLASRSPHHFIVQPVTRRTATEVASRICHQMPDMEVLSPDWELAQARHEHTVLTLTMSGAVILALLLAPPLWADLKAELKTSSLFAALLSGTAGLAAGWMATLVANHYARHTLGLTPFQVPLRLMIAVLAVATGIGLLAVRPICRWPWPMRYATTALVLALCGIALVTVGTLSESLNLSLSEAQRTARDWVTIANVQADQELLRAVQRLPGIRGYVIEAYGGPANVDEERWSGPWPLSGVFYGMRFVGGQGTLSVPYLLGYWRGRPLSANDSNEAVVGYDLAQAQNLDIGDTIRVRGVAFTVVGIRERLHYDPHNDFNQRVDLSLESLRRVLHQPFASGEVTLLIPPARNQEEKSIFLQEMGTRLNVGQVLTIEDRLAEIAASYPAARTLTPADARETVRHARAMYLNILVLCSVLLLPASALAVAGTMAERLTRDERRIGLLKALGAHEGMLLGDYLQRATVLGIAGGLPGVLGGWAISTAFNRLGPSGATELLFTPQLGAGVFFLIVLTAIAAAVAPTSRAVRQDAAWLLYASSLTRKLVTSPMTDKAASGGSEP